MEIGRRLTGTLLELGFKAYGTAAAVSVALSDSETVGGKLYDAAAAVPNLVERYRQAKYLFDHAEEIQAALDYLHRHAPDARQFEAAVQRSYEALDRARAMFGEIEQAKAAFENFWGNPLDGVGPIFDHLAGAWEAMPDFESVSHLADVAQNVTPALHYLNELDLDFARLYGGLLCGVDNFASDEILGTLGVMVLGFGIAFALGMAAGFWGRRGRPGILASTLQGWGARLFAGWYVRHLERILGRSLYAAAREHFERRLREKSAEV